MHYLSLNGSSWLRLQGGAFNSAPASWTAGSRTRQAQCWMLKPSADVLDSLLCPQQVLLDKLRISDGFTVIVQLVSAIVEAIQDKQLVLAAILVPARDTAEALSCSMQSSTSPRSRAVATPGVRPFQD